MASLSSATRTRWIRRPRISFASGFPNHGHRDITPANEIWHWTTPAELLTEAKLRQRWLGKKRVEAPLLVYAYCYKKIRAKKSEPWIQKLRVATSLHVDGRVYARLSEVMVPKYGSGIRHGGWQYICKIVEEDLSYEAIVNVAADWEESGYMVKLAKDPFIKAEMVVRALKGMY